MRKQNITALLAAASLVVAPTAASGAASSSGLAQPARAGATMDESSALNGNSRSAQIALGFLVLVAILAVVLSGDDDGPDNPPVSP